MPTDISQKKIRTRTLVRTLQSLLALPSFTTTIGSDVLPEAILIRNILEEMLSGLVMLSSIVHHLQSDESAEIFIKNIPPKIIQPVEEFREILILVEAGEGVQEVQDEVFIDDYDADTEGDDRVPSRVLRKRRKEKPQSETSFRSQELSDSIFEDIDFIRTARNLLLTIQNDTSIVRSLSQFLSEETGRETLIQLILTLEEFQSYAVSVLNKPYEVHIQEADSLCSSIFATQKLTKSIKKMSTNLEEILESRRVFLETKAAEKAELQESVNTVRLKSQEVITDLKNNIDNKLKGLAWNSHARQVKTTESVIHFKKELEMVTSEHVRLETQLRHANIVLEEEIEEMIRQFDEEMFQIHEEYESVSAEYRLEKVELAQVRSELDAIEQRKAAILQEKLAEEEEERNVELDKIRRRMAAKTIQRAWRARRTRQMLKSKKKKKKK